jgi:hypothetical protein
MTHAGPNKRQHTLLTASIAIFFRWGAVLALAGLTLTPIPILGWFLVVLRAYRATGAGVTLGDTPPFVWLAAVVGLVGGRSVGRVSVATKAQPSKRMEPTRPSSRGHHVAEARAYSQREAGVS